MYVDQWSMQEADLRTGPKLCQGARAGSRDAPRVDRLVGAGACSLRRHRSFASPCVLPLVPGYLSFVTGGAATAGPAEGLSRRRMLPIILFVLGFAIVFTLLGAASGTWVPRLAGPGGQKVA